MEKEWKDNSRKISLNFQIGIVEDKKKIVSVIIITILN